MYSLYIEQNKGMEGKEAYPRWENETRRIWLTWFSANILTIYMVNKWFWMFSILNNGETGVNKIQSLNLSLEFNKEGKKLNTVTCKSYYDRGNSVL